MQGIDRPNHSTVLSAVRWPSSTAPEPSRIVEVAEAVGARTTPGDVPATPGLRWCSANQYRAYPRRSVCCARSMELRRASAAVEPDGIGQVEDAEGDVRHGRAPPR